MLRCIVDGKNLLVNVGCFLGDLMGIAEDFRLNERVWLMT